MGPTSLEDFLEERGYLCPICTDVFSTTDSKKKPVQLSCNQHNLCIDCFTKAMKEMNLNNCPNCRIPLTFTASKEPIPNSQIINAVEIATKLWNYENSSHNASSSASSTSHAPEKKVPESFSCESLCDKVWSYPNMDRYLETALPDLVTVMGWSQVIAEMQQEYQKASHEWCILLDKDNTAKGFVQFKYGQNNTLEAHWAGITKNDISLYEEMYKQLILSCKSKQKGFPDDWKTVSFTSYFNYDSEEKWCNSIVKMLLDHGIRYELTYLHKLWGTQAKLTIYPCSKPGHTQKPLRVSSTLTLQNIPPLKEWIAPTTTPLLTKLNFLFRQSVLDSNNPELAVQILKEAFQNHPENFFIYSINDAIKGFMQFKREQNTTTLTITKCFLAHDSLDYADHFVEQFVEYATTKPLYAPDKAATQIGFPCKETLPTKMQLAIVNRKK